MAKKAKLDILEISTDEKGEGTPPDDVTLEKDGVVISGEERTDGESSSRIKAWLYKPLFWIILLSTLLLVSITGISIWFFYYDDDSKMPVMQEGQSIPGTSAPVKEKMVLFDNFVADLQDEKGNIRIVFCDIALEMEKVEVPDTLSGRVDVRNLIYTTLKRKKTEEVLSPEMRKRLKTELKTELNGLLGENLVKDVYFTRVEVI